METTVSRKPASFRFRTDLLDILKVRAAQCNRSLNNYVESLLLSAIHTEEGKEVTLSAIAEAKEQAEAIKQGRKTVTTVDTSSVEAMLTSLGV